MSQGKEEIQETDKRRKKSGTWGTPAFCRQLGFLIGQIWFRFHD
jgi:hypothetical protein